MNTSQDQNYFSNKKIKTQNEVINYVSCIKAEAESTWMLWLRKNLQDNIFSLFKGSRNYEIAIELFQNNLKSTVISQAFDYTTDQLYLLCKVRGSYYIELIDINRRRSIQLQISSQNDMLLSLSQFGSPKNLHFVLVGLNNIYFIHVNQEMQEMGCLIQLNGPQNNSHTTVQPYKYIRNYRYTNMKTTFDDNYYLYYSQFGHRIQYQRCYQDEMSSFYIGHQFNQVEVSKFTHAMLFFDNAEVQDYFTVLELSNNYSQKVAIKLPTLGNMQQQRKLDEQNLNIQAKFFDVDNKVIFMHGYYIEYYVNTSYAKQIQQKKLLKMNYQLQNVVNIFEVYPQFQLNMKFASIQTSNDKESFYTMFQIEQNKNLQFYIFKIHFKSGQIQDEFSYVFHDAKPGFYIYRLGKHSTSYNGFYDTQMIIQVKKEQLEERETKYEVIQSEQKQSLQQLIQFCINV